MHHQYQAKSLCRGVCILLEQMLPGAFDDVTVSAVAAWGPDEGNHLASFQDDRGWTIEKKQF